MSLDVSHERGRAGKGVGVGGVEGSGGRSVNGRRSEIRGKREVGGFIGQRGPKQEDLYL